MNEWAKVVTHPLGLAGFALFLVFSLLTAKTRRKLPSWLAGAFVTMAFLTLGVGLVLAYRFTGPPITQQDPFHSFVHSYASYGTASQVILEDAGQAATWADSLIIEKAGGALKPEERRRYIIGENEALGNRMLLLQKIGQHAKLLQTCLETLAALDDSKPSSTPDPATTCEYRSIYNLGRTIEDASFGFVKVKDQVPPAPNFSVHGFKVTALENVLKERSQEIERQMALQQAAMKLVVDNLQTDLTVVRNIEESKMNESLAGAGKLPKGLPDRREKILGIILAISSVETAAESAARLRESFVAVVENRLNKASITQLDSTINSVLDSARKIEQARPKD